MDKNFINDEFVQTWEPMYDTIESDQAEYEKLIQTVQNNKITFDLILSIIEWKSVRITGKIDYSKKNEYVSTIELCQTKVNVSPEENMPLLLNLPGFGQPMASTMLHFLKPDLYPIVDIRTITVLHQTGWLNYSKSVPNPLLDYKAYVGILYSRMSGKHHYPQFVKAFYDALDNCESKWSIRQFDRALFSFHKLRLQNELNPSDKNKRICTR